jgi:hypothetical protein
MTGWKMGNCKKTTSQSDTVETSDAENTQTNEGEVIYGLGRGGRPFVGGGMGFGNRNRHRNGNGNGNGMGFRGNRGKGMGRGRGRNG